MLKERLCRQVLISRRCCISAYCFLYVAPSKVIVPTADPTKATETTAEILLEQPSEIDGPIGYVSNVVSFVWGHLIYGSQIDILVASGESTDFQNYMGSAKYSPNLSPGDIYVAARFDRASLPPTFILGDNIEYRGFLNGPLKPGLTYQYALRVHSEADDSLVAISSPLKIGMCVLVQWNPNSVKVSL